MVISRLKEYKTLHFYSEQRLKYACMQNVLNRVNYSVDGEENKNFKRKPSKNPRRPTKMAKVKEKPGSPLWFLRLFSMSYTFKTTNELVILVSNSSKVSQL
jgi:hypothetical protein